MRLSTDETIALIVRWYALIGVVRGGIEPAFARDVLRISGAEFQRVTLGEDPVFKTLSALFDQALRDSTACPVAVQAMVGAALAREPAALRWLALYSEREGKGIPGLDERIAQLQALQATAVKAQDILALDERIGELVEERTMRNLADRRTVEEMTVDALKALDRVMTTGNKGEKRKSATAILNHAINLAKQEKISEVVMQAILPSIRRFSEEMARLAESRMDPEAREAWRMDAEEQLRQLLLSVATFE